jgi:5-methylthioadenosine/S-adenosylhomocysteine deaminase
VILVDLDTIPFTPLNDIRRQLVFCESGTSVSLVIVDGTIVVEDGRILTVDEGALRAEIRATAEERRAGFAETHSHAEKLAEYYTAMYQMARARDVGMERLVPPFVRT